MKTKIRVYIAVALLLVSMLFSSIAFNPVSAQTIVLSAWTPSKPTIDGVIGSTEWSYADTVSFTLPSSKLKGTLYVMNDAENLYIAISVNDPDFSSQDMFRISFENDNDGILEVGDDSLFYAGYRGFEDDFYKFPLAYDTVGGGTMDGEGDASRVGSLNHFELSHPLDSADDDHDFSLSLGDTVGFALAYASEGDELVGNEWPGPLYGPATNWGDITIASPPTKVFSAWTKIVPKIDGYIGEREWAYADTATYETTGGIKGTFYVMNDAENLYIALTTSDSTLSENEIIDRVWLYFDNDNDGIGPEVGDDIYGWSGYQHEHFRDGFCGSLGSYVWDRDIDDKGTSDGAAEAQNIDRTYNSFEIMHPLNSKDDAHDFSLKCKDLVGFALRLTVNSVDKGWWPTSDLKLWHEILIACPPRHDVAVTYVGVYPNYVRQGDSVLVGAIVKNEGDYTETFDVTIYATRTVVILPWWPPIVITVPIETKEVTSLLPGGSRILIFVWNTLGFALDDYTIKAYAHPVTGETDTADNTRVDGVVQVYKGIGYFIIVAGNHYGNKLDKINYGCNEVFKTLLTVGYTGSRIYYLNQPEYYPQDVDGDGLNDIDAIATSANLQWAIETWAGSRVGPSEPLFMYLFDHGGENSFCIDSPDTVSAAQLGSWLDTLEEATAAPIHVIYAACHSGSFIEELSGTGRVIATSCRTTEGSSVSPDGKWEAFSQPFWNKIESGHSVGWSFDEACSTMISGGYTYKPLLDDNADATGHTGPLPNAGDGYIADTLYIGSCEWPYPWISYVVQKQYFTWPPPSYVRLWATVENETPLVHVDAWMQPPDWEPPPPDLVLADTGFERFRMEDPDHDGTWTVDIPARAFTAHATGPSNFRFIITAEEENGNTATPLATSVEFVGEVAASGVQIILPPPDTETPTVHIERPIDMETVNGVIKVNGTASDDVCLDKAELYVDGDLKSTVNLPATSNSYFEFSFDTSTVANGPRTVFVKAYDTSENEGGQTLIVVVNNDNHDIAVTDVKTYKMVVGKGYNVNINVTVVNQGSYAETTQVTTQADGTTINTLPVTLNPQTQKTLTFKWNTQEFAKGEYTISAYANPVPGEKDLTDNTYVDSWVIVTIPGDIDGDYDVDHKDLLLLASAYGSEVGDPRYIPEADINCSGEIDHKDLLILAANYGKTDC